jgi:hypothetical protein
MFWEQEKPEARKMLENTARPSGSPTRQVHAVLGCNLSFEYMPSLQTSHNPPRLLSEMIFTCSGDHTKVKTIEFVSGVSLKSHFADKEIASRSTSQISFWSLSRLNSIRVFPSVISTNVNSDILSMLSVFLENFIGKVPFGFLSIRPYWKIEDI